MPALLDDDAVQEVLERCGENALRLAMRGNVASGWQLSCLENPDTAICTHSIYCPCCKKWWECTEPSCIYQPRLSRQNAEMSHLRTCVRECPHIAEMFSGIQRESPDVYGVSPLEPLMNYLIGLEGQRRAVHAL